MKSFFKAFDKDMKCRGFQFVVGETYEEPKADLCNCGFHACENPLDVLDYYDLCESRLGIVELDGISEQRKDDSKVVGKKITIKAELNLPGFIKAAIEFLLESTKLNNSAQLAASGDRAQLAASGVSAKLAASGVSAQLAASGDSAKLAASGYSAKLAASGDRAKLAASGDRAQLAASGDSAQLAASGRDSVVMCAGMEGKAKATIGSWITLAEWGYDENADQWKPKKVVTKKVDGEKIKENAWYMLQNGVFTIVDGAK